MLKHEWRKYEKDLYIPPSKPVEVKVPRLKFFTIEGQGNPNDEAFSEYISALYSISYAVKMSYRSDLKPGGYFEYTVYPLEGVWDITDEAKKTYNGKIDKDSLVFNLMIRQPDFVNTEFAKKIIQATMKKKPHPLLDKVKFQSIIEGKCLQMMHRGSFDDEPKSFALMQDYCDKKGLVRESKLHREIYLSDVRKVSPEKLKTVLRFKIK